MALPAQKASTPAPGIRVRLANHSVAVVGNASADASLGFSDPTVGVGPNDSWLVLESHSFDPVGGDAVQVGSVPLSGVGSGTTTLNVTGADARGPSVESASSATVTVEPAVGFRPSAYDTDGDDSVEGDLRGILRAIADYDGGEIRLDQVLAVIAA